MLACIPREDPGERQVLEQIGNLPPVLDENSGMAALGDLIWFINDSGNEPTLYGYDSDQDTIVRSVVVKNVVNTDWEELTQNENYFFIGDFGNNSGSRTDLRIIRINKTDLLAENDSVNPSGIIEFSYEDQTDFTPTDQGTSFDCEAFIALDDSLVLFTKDSRTMNTQLYTIPVTSGTHVAKLRNQWKVNGLITAAAWSSEKQELWLLGYTPFIPFIWVYHSFNPDELNYSNANRTEFQEFFGRQTEGIMISGNGSIYISSEGTTQYPPALFRLEL